MQQCIELSLNNAQRLVEDAEILLKPGRLSSAKVLAVFSLEEVGKALLACDYFAERKKVSSKDYKRFLNHVAKIDKALEALEEVDIQRVGFRKAVWGDIAKELHTQKIDAVFVNYNGRYRVWHIPWSQDPSPLVTTYKFIDPETAETIRKAQEPIDELFVENLIKDVKMVICLARQKLEQIGIP